MSDEPIDLNEGQARDLVPVQRRRKDGEDGNDTLVVHVKALSAAPGACVRVSILADSEDASIELAGIDICGDAEFPRVDTVSFCTFQTRSIPPRVTCSLRGATHAQVAMNVDLLLG